MWWQGYKNAFCGTKIPFSRGGYTLGGGGMYGLRGPKHALGWGKGLHVTV